MKKGFVFYSNWAAMIEELPDDMVGQLLKMICRYEFSGEVIESDPIVTAIFKGIKPSLDMNSEKYQKKVERVKEAREKRISMKSDRNQTEINMKSDRNQSEIKCITDTVTDTDTVTVSSKEDSIYIVGKPDFTSEIKQIIDYLNKKTQSNFKAKTEATKKSIIARLKEGYTVEDFFRVIDAKVKDWSDDPDMREYLRPQTLFRPSNFEAYLNEANRPQVKSKNAFKNFKQNEYTADEYEKLISN